jgi:hypothetical protein
VPRILHLALKIPQVPLTQHPQARRPAQEEEYDCNGKHDAAAERSLRLGGFGAVDGPLVAQAM